MKNVLFLSLGLVLTLLGIIGAFLPVMPTTPFMILALGCFAETSPRFHAMLLNNRWIGSPLRQWDQTKTVRRRTKIQALIMLIIAFGFSITLLWGHIELQLMLLVLAAVMIGFVLRLKEAEPKYED